MKVPFVADGPTAKVPAGHFKITGRLLFFFVCLVSTLTFNIISLVLHAVYDRIPYSPPILSIMITLGTIGWLPLDYHLKKKDLLRTGSQNRPKSFVRSAVQEFVWVMNWVAILEATIVLSVDYIDNPLRRGLLSANNPLRRRTQAQRIALTVMSIFSIVSQAVLSASFANLNWPSIHRSARSVVLLCSAGELCLAFFLLSVNLGFRNSATYARTATILQLTGALTSAVSILGFAISISIKGDDRNNSLLTRFIRFHVGLSSVIVVISLVGLGLGLNWLFQVPDQDQTTQQALTIDAIVISVNIILQVLGIVLIPKIQNPSTSPLSVEVIDLASLPPSHRDEYGKLITLYAEDPAGMTSGGAAIELMMAYEKVNLFNMQCKVLRVYNPTKELGDKVKNGSPALGAMDEKAKNYEDIWSWKNLDEENRIFETESQIKLLATPKMEEAPPPKPLSKKQKIKLAKLAAEAEASGTNGIPLQKVKTVDEIQAEKKFQDKLVATEAFVLLTTISGYDLTASIPGLPGRILSSTLGANSYFKPLCVRLGLLATHWPFRRAVFYTSSTKKPVARSAAVARAIIEWNERQPRCKRYQMFLDPIYQYENVKKAISPSGWQSIPLPSSHIIDLRPHRNATITEYMKAIKYKRQDGPFNTAGGTMEVTQDFSLENVQRAYTMWKNVAEKRTSDGNTAVLATPDEQFLAALGDPVSNSRGDRSLMFLKLANGEVVASCVLFRLGNTITSDLQGLNYEHGRPVKAYFVMMQYVIDLALKEGLSFIDFGPTAAEPKISIGCKSVPLVGAAYAGSTILSMGIGFAASGVKTNS